MMELPNDQHAISVDRPLQLTCIDCDDTFEFTAGEQAYFTERGLKLPKRCKPCRIAKREAVRAARVGYGE